MSRYSISVGCRVLGCIESIGMFEFRNAWIDTKALDLTGLAFVVWKSLNCHHPQALSPRSSNPIAQAGMLGTTSIYSHCNERDFPVSAVASLTPRTTSILLMQDGSDSRSTDTKITKCSHHTLDRRPILEQAVVEEKPEDIQGILGNLEKSHSDGIVVCSNRVTLQRKVMC